MGVIFTRFFQRHLSQGFCNFIVELVSDFCLRMIYPFNPQKKLQQYYDGIRRR